MSPIPELLAKQIQHTESLIKSGEVHHPFSQQVVLLADLVMEATQTQPDIRRNALLNKVLENQQIESLALHYDEDMAQMGLMSFIGTDILTLTRHALRNISLVLSEEEKQQIGPIQEKIQEVNDPKGILILTQTAKLLIPHLIKTVQGESTNPTNIIDIADGKEQEYDFDFRTLEANPSIINSLIELSK